MALPNCTIEVSYLEAPNEDYAYFCVSHSPPWQVTLDGTICPPTRSRVIQLSVKDPATKFTGIRIANNRADILNSNEDYLNDENVTGITVTPQGSPGQPYSTSTITLEDLMPSATTSPLPTRLFYAVRIGSHTWDDPKVYNPGDD